jgi:SRP40, C-terminal domain
LSDTGVPLTQNTPFKRVKEDSINYRDNRLRDNTFFSKADTYGLRAHQDLSITRGKGFRKVMTKKKRQAHHGGTLDASNVSSFKFSDSDSD